MNLWDSLSGTYEIEITSASVSDALTAINAAHIHLLDVNFVDDLTFRGKVRVYAYRRLRLLLNNRGESIKVLKRDGLFWTFLSLKSRPVLLVGMAIFLIMALYLPSKVLFVRIEGNTTVPTKMIIEKVQQCGIRFGTSRRQVRSEKVKNALLSAVPQLRWAGINTYGCVAVISVREKALPKQNTPVIGAASIVAKTDGIITEMTVIRGTPLCRVGQAVKEGQVLVSGYTDCGLSIRAEIANAEVFAQTRRQLEVVSPCSFEKMTAFNQKQRNYYLKIGKKLIKFSKDSGISGARCVKMYKENYLLLPGGFQLPIAIVTEELIGRKFVEERASIEKYAWMKDYANQYLTGQMLAGEILESDFSAKQEDDKFTITGNYACLEMIGQVHYEEIIDGNGKRN